MGPQDFELIERRAVEVMQSHVEASYITEGIKRYLETSAPLEWHFGSENQYQDVIKILGLTDFDGSQVIHTYYENENGFDDEIDGKVGFGNTWKVEYVWEAIANRYAAIVEFVNDYTASFAIKLDDKTVVIFGVEHTETVGICADCLKNEEYMEFNADYNCGHDIQDTYDSKRWLLMLDIADMDRVDWGRGQVQDTLSKKTTTH